MTQISRQGRDKYNKKRLAAVHAVCSRARANVFASIEASGPHKGKCMNSANKTLISILLGLVVAVVVGISAGAARGATVDVHASIDTTPTGGLSPPSISASD